MRRLESDHGANFWARNTTVRTSVYLLLEACTYHVCTCFDVDL
jgi:hypothetical protein